MNKNKEMESWERFDGSAVNKRVQLSPHDDHVSAHFCIYCNMLLLLSPFYED